MLRRGFSVSGVNGEAERCGATRENCTSLYI
jgi:hypothetical protein